jgi:hypothetical protein
MVLVPANTTNMNLTLTKTKVFKNEKLTTHSQSQPALMISIAQLKHRLAARQQCPTASHHLRRSN